VSHPILKNESDVRSEAEIARSVADLETLLGRDVKYFAYPNGLPGIDFSGREEVYLDAAGVELAFTTESRGVNAGDHRYRVPRIPISPGENIGRIWTKLRFATAWNVLKKGRPNGEYVQRRQLGRRLSFSSGTAPSK
jgi:peptidoglycan/xylan/chitin deacetylase (PgdA/CDA1 family)